MTNKCGKDNGVLCNEHVSMAITREGNVCNTSQRRDLQIIRVSNSYLHAANTSFLSSYRNIRYHAPLLYYQKSPGIKFQATTRSPVLSETGGQQTLEMT